MRKIANSNIFKSYNIQVRTPDGTMYVVIAEDHSGYPFKIDVFAGKAGTSFSAWAASLAAIIEELWRNKVTTPTVIRLIGDSYTGSFRTNIGNIKVFSGPQGIKYALMRYMNMKKQEEKVDRPMAIRHLQSG